MNESKEINIHGKEEKLSCIKEDNDVQNEIESNIIGSIKEKLNFEHNTEHNITVGIQTEFKCENKNVKANCIPSEETFCNENVLLSLQNPHKYEQNIKEDMFYDKKMNQCLEGDTSIKNCFRPRRRLKRTVKERTLSDSLQSDFQKEEGVVSKMARTMISMSQDIDSKASGNSEPVAHIALDKISYDIKIDPNMVDRYTKYPVILLPGRVMPSVESQETLEKRMKEENLVVARHGRLHPANEKYNQGAVIDPPLISPGKIVGYTPAGQRHEVDLNFQRPTWFNSEYARMQFDDATKINVSRMFHELENGRFLPDNLDPHVEREYFAEHAHITKDATKYFENCTNKQSIPESTLSKTHAEEHYSLLESEHQLIQLNKFAAIKYLDFPEELAKKLSNALAFKLTPLMFLKNPIIVDTIEMLTINCSKYEVVRPALALLNKIKSLFDVPESLTFKEYFQSEVLRLKEKTKDMNSFDILMMTEEPTGEKTKGINGFDINEEPTEEKTKDMNGSDILMTTEEPTETNSKKIEIAVIQRSDPTNNTNTSQSNELQGEWVTVREEDLWIDNNDNTSEEIVYNQSSNYDSDDNDNSDGDDDDDENDIHEFSSTDVYSVSSSSDEEDERSHESNPDVGLEELIDNNIIYGMLFPGIPGYMVLNYFQYI